MGAARDGANATAELTLAIGALAAAGIRTAYVKYKEHKEKEHLERVKDVYRLYKTYLVDIQVKDDDIPTGEKLSFPKIFDLDNPENPTKAESLKLTDSILEDLNTQVPTYGNPRLASAARCFLDAISYLREFHYDRIHENEYGAGNAEDVTSSVICYLILMISIHCIKFEGTARSIAYLDGLINFVRAYASSHKVSGSINKQNFERLTYVHGELVIAQNILKKHSILRSSEEMLAEFLPVCAQLSDRMVKNYSKLIVPIDEREKIAYSTLARLSRGEIKSKFEHDKKFHIPFFREPKAILIRNSPLQHWIERCSENFLIAEAIAEGRDDVALSLINEGLLEKHKRFLPKHFELLNDFKGKLIPAKKLQELAKLHFFTKEEINALKQKVITPKEFSKMVNKGYFSEKIINSLRNEGLFEYLFKARKLSKSEIEELQELKLFTAIHLEDLTLYQKQILSTDEIKKLEAKKFTQKEMDALHAVFNECDNFLTRHPEHLESKAIHNFVVITDSDKIVARAGILSNYATLIDQLSAIYCLGLNLKDTLKQLRKDKAHKSEAYTLFLLDIFTGLAEQIRSRAKTLLSELAAIKKENADYKAMLDEAHYQIFQDMIDLLEVTAGANVNKVTKFTDKHIKQLNNPNTIDEVDIESHPIVKMAYQYLCIYKLKTKQIIKKREGSCSLSEDNNHVLVNLVNNISSPPPNQPIVEIKVDETKEAKSISLSVDVDFPVLTQSPKNTPVMHHAESKESTEARLPNNISALLILVEKELQDLKTEILKIPTTKLRRSCLDLHKQLFTLRERSQSIQNEYNDDRLDKARELLKITHCLSKDTVSFLKVLAVNDMDGRKEALMTFKEKMKAQLHSDVNNEIIDEHKSLISRLVADIVNLVSVFGVVNLYRRGGFGVTTSRIHADKVENAVDSIKVSYLA